MNWNLTDDIDDGFWCTLLCRLLECIVYYFNKLQRKGWVAINFKLKNTPNQKDGSQKV